MPDNPFDKDRPTLEEVVEYHNLDVDSMINMGITKVTITSPRNQDKSYQYDLRRDI